MSLRVVACPPEGAAGGSAGEDRSCADPDPVGLTRAALALLMPMHLLLDGDARIVAAGPTLLRLAGGRGLTGRNLDEVFELRRPAGAATLERILAQGGRGLRLRFRDPPATAFKGAAVPLAGRDGALVNLSLGFGAAQAVAEHRLTAADFAATDLTVELLYLIEAMSAAMAESRDLNRRLERAHQAARTQALTDPLTGLVNRRAFDAELARLVARRRPFGVIHLDLDHFKAVNDTLGHAAGDAVLAAAARVLREGVRAGDLAARTGGDEFLLLLPGLGDRRELAAIAQRIIRRIEAPVPVEGGLARVSASAGVAVFDPARPAEPAALLAEADAALYAAKHAGRGRAATRAR
jgi:diguanylate cyclase (GGDEF)-like protein